MRKISAVTLAMVFLALLAPQLAAEERGQASNRVPYIIFSEEPSLKSAFGVRHNFPGMFTTELSSEEVELLNRFGLRTAPVELYRVTRPPKGGGGGGGTQGRVYFPSDQTPWGIETVYGDGTITSTSGGAGINVAVLDTGVYKGHLDLKNRVAQCVNFTGGPMEGKCADGHGHGTHVAGTILADGGSDGKGIYGVAPEANLLAYKVCNNTGCWADDIAAAIDYAGTHGAHIVSMSLGGDSESILIRDAIDRNPDLLYIAAAGNDGPADGTIDYPAANPKVVAVGAIDNYLWVPDWSSRGVNDGDCIVEAQEVEFGAPGVSIESTWKDGSYMKLSGTSMATPHVSGLAAKLWQGGASATRSYLQSMAEDIWEAGKDDTATGFGLPRVVEPLNRVVCSTP